MAIILIAAAFFGVLTMGYMFGIDAIAYEDNTFEQPEERAGAVLKHSLGLYNRDFAITNVRVMHIKLLQFPVPRDSWSQNQKRCPNQNQLPRGSPRGFRHPQGMHISTTHHFVRKWTATATRI
jgi:hypothetical protein